MQFQRLILPFFLSTPLSLGLACAHAQTAGESTTTTTTTVITTEVPPPKEAVVEPAGYVSCTTTIAGWQGEVWHPDYKICRYETQSETVKGEAWVAAHWQCTQYTVKDSVTECTNWDWAQGRWVATIAEVQ